MKLLLTRARRWGKNHLTALKLGVSILSPRSISEIRGSRKAPFAPAYRIEPHVPGTSPWFFGCRLRFGAEVKVEKSNLVVKHF
jgi:hypothetical protein